MLASTRIEIRHSSLHGRGVFARAPLRRGALLETCPVLVLPAREVPDRGNLGRYVFEWGRGRYGLALGATSLVNHSTDPNVAVEADPDAATLRLVALRPIAKDEELLLDYGYDPTR